MSSTLIVELDMKEFCQVTEMPAAFVIEIVEHGILEPQGQRPDDWLFDAHALAVARQAIKLQHDLELEWDGVALALDLLSQVERLRAENFMLKQRLGRFLLD
ncbi:chaperone modulator CbpM [Pseudomonas sp. 10B1]|uniref:chaperone modulator CbpM n=1 Tax=unclassified Pseudomonas TaxID=196821 RepID=UPI002AB3A1C4|nr:MULTISPECIES: chaperone modulator CbpM [unclassified Pseudomonas]MDY7563173.1 chaperone modulator CbpM [Pseudomonas sp. AB6]MEA9979385.1 chaperone modulator CbpM [Pseudomonas sp. RTS4]MEA9993745.1 chaperone modulator CbpM [Pseudomonas sp. AA4]MEB0085086.1 chaperone modulator CbpM [Pseudomonas sp. RTI1]MEB0125189.1 chaperone modulator CbpM [Pseudomonas sp. CCC1.2]